jgi:ribose transport system substrate-binding protein
MHPTGHTSTRAGRFGRSGRAVTIFAAAGSLMLAACSSSKSSSGSSTTGGGSGATASSAPGSTAAAGDIASFQADLAKATAAPTYNGPTSGPAPQSGKKIAVVECAAQNTGCAAAAANVKQANAAIGWSTNILDGKGTPAGASQAMISAINDGVDGIVLIAIASPTIIQGMSAAKKANVPVVSVVGDNPVGTGTDQVYAEISGSTVESGKAIADYFVVQSKGTAKVAAFHVASLVSTVNRYKGFINEIKKCGGCKVESDKTYGLVSQSEFTNLIKGTVNANPGIQYIFVDISQYATIAATALQQMGLQKKIGVAGIDCLPPEVQSIKDQTGEVACANARVALSGYAATNELIRAFAKQKPLNEAYPFRLIDKAIIDKESDPYLGGFDVSQGYLKLWGKA